MRILPCRFHSPASFGVPAFLPTHALSARFLWLMQWVPVVYAMIRLRHTMDVLGRGIRRFYEDTAKGCGGSAFSLFIPDVIRKPKGQCFGVDRKAFMGEVSFQGAGTRDGVEVGFMGRAKSVLWGAFVDRG